MNHIRFMFNRIYDYSKIHEDKSEHNDLLDMEISLDCDHTQDYCKSIVNDIKQNLPDVKSVEYLGCVDRFANEVYTLTTEKAVYKVSLTFDSFHGKDTTLQVDILPEYGEISEDYDRLLEKIKIEFKERLIKDWKHCFWMIDEPSEKLCAELYSRFFEKENEIRAFVNRVLLLHLGADWLNCSGLEKYYESAQERAKDFIQKVPELNDINIDLISLTLESLFEIVFNASVYNDEIVLSRVDQKTLNQILQSKGKSDKSDKSENIRNFIEKRRTGKINLWEDIFTKYFDNPDKFKSDVHKFISSRNHVAHNKLITRNAYNIILSELEDISEELNAAEENFENAEPSKEQIMTREAEEEDDSYDDREYWRFRVSDETGIDVLDEDQILEKFEETVSKIYEDLLKQIHFDPCYAIGNLEDIADSGKTCAFTIRSNASEESVIKICTDVVIDDEMGESSEMTLSCEKDGAVLFYTSVVYVNGEGSEDEDFRMQVVRDSEYDDFGVDEFVEELINYIEEDLNPLLAELSGWHHDAVKEGGPEPVADFPCDECGKFGVSILQAFYPVGKCCYCGFENEVHVCSLCGTVFNELGGEGDLCNGCLPKDDD